jgi:hypothetical protein
MVTAVTTSDLTRIYTDSYFFWVIIVYSSTLLVIPSIVTRM